MTNAPAVQTDPAPYAGRLRASFDGLLRTLALLEPEEMDATRLENGWSPTALLAHIAYWDGAQCARMEDAVAGRAGAWSATLHEGNDARAAEDGTRPFDEVLAEAEANRMRLAEFAASLSSEALAREYPEGRILLSLPRLLDHMVNHTHRHTQDLFSYASCARRWSRAALRSLLDTQHSAVMESIAGLDEATLLSVYLSQEWTVRDHLVHILAWSEYAYRRMECWPELDPGFVGDWLTAEGETEDTVNARLHNKRIGLTMIEVVDWLATWHRRLLRKLDEIADEEFCAFGDYGWSRQGDLCGFLYGTCLHQAEHAEEIWMWRAGMPG